MKRIRNGISASEIVAAVFITLGAAFGIVSLAIAARLGPAKEGGGASAVSLVFGLIALPFLAAGLIIAAFAWRKRRRIRKAVASGNYVMATVADLRANYSVEVNGQNPYVLECHYEDPDTGILHVFKSRNIFYYPEELLGQSIKVYVDPQRPDSYYVDVDGLSGPVDLH